MAERPESDESVEADLQALLADPMPASVVAAASGLWTWRTIDAELAELSEQELAASSAGVRDGGTVELRSYEAAGITIEVELDWRERTLTAQVLPSQRAELRAVMEGGRRTTTVTSDSGVFELRDVGSGPLQLHVSTVGTDPPASIKTPWFAA
jgi:hypothetical protein